MNSASNMHERGTLSNKLADIPTQHSIMSSLVSFEQVTSFGKSSSFP